MHQMAMPESVELSKIVELVRETGQPITLTQGGRAVVDIVPHAVSRGPKRNQAEVIAELKAIAATMPKMTLEEIKEAIAEGRR